VKVQAPFGFVTGCHAGDKFMVQATLASMRHYCPDAPLCLVVDGEFDVSDLMKEYDLRVLRVSALPVRQMRALISGNGRAKLAAMWEGPFERYVWLDSDAIVWGDFTAQLCTDVDFQIFWSEISIPRDSFEVPDWMRHFYFDPQKLRRFDADFEWRGHAYFSSGAFACKRDVIPFEKWMEAELWAKETPGLFGDFSEQPLLNYFVHSMSERGEIRIRMSNLQHIWNHHGKEELMHDCLNAGWHFPTKIQRPRVAHFCGRKPLVSDPNAFSRPFTIARLEHHRHQRSDLGAWLAIMTEEAQVIAAKAKGRLLRYFGQIGK
jgi:hypothetical protein